MKNRIIVVLLMMALAVSGMTCIGTAVTKANQSDPYMGETWKEATDKSDYKLCLVGQNTSVEYGGTFHIEGSDIYVAATASIVKPNYKSITLNDEELNAWEGAYLRIPIAKLNENADNIVKIVDFFNNEFTVVIRSGNPYPEEDTQAPTEPVTEKPQEDAIQIEGFQISTSFEGFRIVSSVEQAIGDQNVTNWGIIYGVKILNGRTDTEISEDDLVAGANSTYVKAYESTAKGTLPYVFGESKTATYYARTMKFGKKSKGALTSVYMVRPYAMLEDGSCVYGEVKSFTVNQIADLLYKNIMMNSLEEHNYLYNNILKIVDPDYTEVNYEWSKTIAPPDLV